MAIATTRTRGIVGLIGAIILLFGSVAVFATVAGFFGSTWWLFDLAADYRFPLMLTLVGVAIAYGFGYGRGAAVIFLGAAVVNAVLIVPLWIAQQPKAATGNSIRVVAFDVEGDDQNRAEIFAWLDSVDADIVFLQGTDAGWAAAVAATGTPYRVLAGPPGEDPGTTVLAHPAVSVTAVSVTAASVTDGEPHTEIVTELDGATLTLIGVDAEIPASSDEADARLEYFAAIAARAAEVETRVAVVGNLSTTRWSHAFRVLAGDLPLRSSEDGNGYSATWSIYPTFGLTAAQHLLGLPIDHVLMSEDLTATAHTIGPDLGPNHRGVVVDLARAGA